MQAILNTVHPRHNATIKGNKGQVVKIVHDEEGRKEVCIELPIKVVKTKAVNNRLWINRKYLKYIN